MSGRATRRACLGTAGGAGAAFVAACGAPAAPAAPAERSPIEGIRPGGGITWSLWAISQERADGYLVQLKDFTAQTGIQVEMLWTDSGVYRDKIVSLLSAGTPPELMQVDAYWMAGFVQQGALQKLDPYLKGDRAGTSIGGRPNVLKLDDFLPGAIQEHTHLFRGTYYGIPNAPEAPRVVWFNRTKWLQSGLPLPNQLDEQGRWTWDTFVEHLSRVSSGEDPNRSYGTAAQLGFHPEPHSFIFSNGGKSLSDDLQSFVADMKETVEALQFQADLIHKHQVAPRPGVSLGSGDTFFSGRMATQITTSGPAATAMTRPDFDYGIAPLPKSPRGIRKTVLKPNASTLPVGISGQRAAAAWELLKYLTSYHYQKAQIDTGQALTNRKDQVDYLVKSSPIKGVKVFADAYERREVMSIPLIPKWIEYRAIYDEEFNKVRRGEVGVPAALSAIKARVAGLLRT
jgi:multiple sugar transport system substrate-binding protein